MGKLTLIAQFETLQASGRWNEWCSAPQSLIKLAQALGSPRQLLSTAAADRTPDTAFELGALTR
jgi:hypothetical protein